ncbi:ParB/RepB/Spo0J family partition protein, partial [Streptomyces brasiliscabiei]|uniref:ParB N-terminal domain-containing protein n=1 Tax=Streptomyces brasiliscabiei TaxID=2736302 RepID=UPI003014928B
PEEAAGDALRSLALGVLQPGRFQPRTGMDAARLTELADSIRVQGVIQPIVVREIGKNQFEIIAGERRWRAAQEAGLAEIPAVVREVDDRA